MRWLREHDLLLVLFGSPLVVAVLQAAGAFHV
jgi:hypothetical protein